MSVFGNLKKTRFRCKNVTWSM